MWAFPRHMTLLHLGFYMLIVHFLRHYVQDLHAQPSKNPSPCCRFSDTVSGVFVVAHFFLNGCNLLCMSELWGFDHGCSKNGWYHKSSALVSLTGMVLLVLMTDL